MRKSCCDNKHDMNNVSWSMEEDEKLVNYVTAHGEGCWGTVPQAAGLLRSGRSCRERWLNYLKPNLTTTGNLNFSEDEEDLIIRLHALLGNRWSLIAGRLPGRTDDEIKNYWNSHLSMKLLNMGIDPNNHRLGNNNSGTSTVAESQAENEQVPSENSSNDDQEINSSPPDLNLGL